MVRLFAVAGGLLVIGACQRQPAEPPTPPRAPRTEIPADAALRWISDPLPATRPPGPSRTGEVH